LTAALLTHTHVLLACHIGHPKLKFRFQGHSAVKSKDKGGGGAKGQGVGVGVGGGGDGKAGSENREGAKQVLNLLALLVQKYKY
jgi:hypothetical protein